MPDGVSVASGRASLGTVSGRGGRAKLLGFVTDATTETALREGLADVLGVVPDIRRADIRKAIAALQRGAAASTLIVDVSGEDQPLAALEDLAQAVEPNVTVLVVGDRQDMDFYRRITRGLGVREYLFKPLTSEIVARHFGTVLDGRTNGETVLRGGRVLAVAGARGGAGASTVATNLAWHLGERLKCPTVLVDADLQTGTAATMLGAQVTPALQTALEHPGRLDELFIERAVQAAGPMLDVLASEVPLDQPVPYTQGAAERLIELLKRRYNYIVIDLPVGQGEIARAFNATGYQGLLVLDPTLPAVRDTLRLLALPQPPRHVSRPQLVLNRAGAPGGLTQAQVGAALHGTPLVAIPDLGRRVREAELTGKPAASQDGPMQTVIAQLARSCAGAHPVAASGGLLRRLFK